MPKFDEYPRPSLAVDPAVLRVVDGRLVTHLWRRTWEPYAGAWALPGVFVAADESLEDAVQRGIRSKVGLEPRYVQQLFTWNRPGRDVRGWVVTVAYFAIAASKAHLVEPAPATVHDQFFLAPSSEPDQPVRLGIEDSAGGSIELAFDHADILAAVIERLRADIWTTDISLRFLEPEFTLRSLQSVFEAILGRPLNKDSFRRRVVQTQQLVAPTGRLEENVSHRPAELYRAATVQA